MVIQVCPLLSQQPISANIPLIFGRYFFAVKSYFPAVLHAQAHAFPNSGKFVTKRHPCTAPMSISENTLVGSMVSSELAYPAAPFLNSSLVELPRTQSNISMPSSKVRDNQNEDLLSLFDQMIKSLLKTQTFLADTASDLALQNFNPSAMLSELHEEQNRRRRLFCFSQIIAKFVAIVFRTPLNFPSDFFDKLGNGGNMEFREQVQSIGAPMGVTVDHILEWEPFVRGKFGVANPDFSKTEFIAVAMELIAEHRLSEFSVGVIETVYNTVEAHQIQMQASKPDPSSVSPKY